MPKLSELITGAPAVGGATAPRLKLSQVTAQPADPAKPSLFRMDSDFAERGDVGQINIGVAALKDMFGSRLGAAEYLAEKSGGSVVTDEAGDPLVQLPDGTRYRLNDSGLDTTDVANVSGNVAAMWTPAAWLSKFAKARQVGLAGRVGLQATGAAAGDTALQASFDEGRVDPVRVGATAAGAGFGETLGTGIAWAANKITSLLANGATAKATAQEIARDAGANLTEQQMTRLATRVAQIKAGADPRALLGQEEFGFLYTQGQRLAEGVPQKWGVLSREELLRQQPGSAEVFNAAGRQNTARLDETLTSMTARQGTPAAATPAELAQGAASRLKGQADELDTRIGDAYDKAAELQGAAISADAVRGLPARLTQAVREFSPHPSTTPATAQTLEQVRNATQAILKGVEGGNVSGVTLRAFETQRRILNNNINAASNKADRAAMVALKREFDGWLDEAVDGALVSGDPAALKAVKEARGLRAEFARRFEGGADSDKFIAGLLDGSKTPEELVNVALGASQVSKAGAARFIERLRVAADGDPEVIGALRSAHFLRLTRGANGEPLQMGQIVRNIRTSDYNNASVVRALYSPAEWAEIRRLAGALEPLVAKGDFARTSGTAERAARMLAQRIGGGLPIIGETVQGIFAGKNWVQANRAFNAPVTIPSYSPPGFQPAGAAIGEEYVTR
jgi:hypothetical protein